MREQSTVERLDRGVAGTEKTLGKMHKLVALGKLDPTMQRIATWIRLQVPRDPRATTPAVLDRVFRWVKRHGIFQRDPFQIEKIEHPIAAMRPIIEARRKGVYRGPGLFVGDCDTIAGVYLATLGGILGFHYAWEVAKVDPARPTEFSHVWVAFRVGADWYPLDPSTSNANPGWRPPVPPDLFARYPEGPIEDTLGLGGNGMMNGLGQNGAARIRDESVLVPADYFGYGVPKSIGDGPMRVPVASPSDLQFVIPPEPEIPRADLEPGVGLIRKVPLPSPAWRIGPMAGQRDDHGPPYYNARPGGDARNYVRVERRFYPQGSTWNQKLPVDVGKYHKAGPYVQVQAPGSPERQVEVHMGPMIGVERGSSHRRRGWLEHRRALPGERTIVLEPQEIPPGGMGQEPDMMTPAERDAAAKEASTDVWSVISKTITKAAPGLTTAAVTKLQAHYAGRLSSATQRATGVPVPAATFTHRAGAWYEQPWAWIGGVLVIGGTAYALSR